MVNEQPAVSPTGRYSVMETCKILGIHRNTLRKYTRQGRIRCGVRRVNARIFYTGSEILSVWMRQI